MGLAGPPARQEALHTDIFVQIRPVDSYPAADETPMGSFRRCPVRQAREPSQRHSDGPTVGKIDD